MILCTDHLSRIVQGKRLVDNVTVSFCEGDVTAIVGPSGAGKSSFLRLLNRLDEPSEGTVFLKGQDYREINPPELRRRLGMVMQSPFLFAGTVSDNIRFGPHQRGEELPPEIIQRLLKRVRLEGYAEREIANLSIGEAQRVSLARTLANAPQILLLDEPTSALDEATKKDVEALINDIVRGQKLTCLIVTHDTDQAQRMADRILVMEAGRVIKSGPAAEVLNA